MTTQECPAGPDELLLLEKVAGCDAQDVYALSASVFDAWRNYWTALFSARGLDDLYAANTALLSDTLGLTAHAAGVRQQFAGVVTPTLNEA